MSGSPDLVWGIQPVRALLEHEGQVRRLLLVRGRHGGALRELREKARVHGVPVVLRGRAELDRATGGAVHQGVAAVAAALPYAGQESLLAGTGEDAFLVILDGVEDPRNLGAILRTAAAVGADGVFLPSRRAAGLTPTALKASAGAAARIPVARVTNLSRLIEQLQDRGVRVVAVEAGAPAPWAAAEMSGPLALVLGGEGRGIRRLVRQKCDAAVGLPLDRGIESLNVSVAFGIVAYEVRRRRSGASPGSPPRERRSATGRRPEDVER